LLNFKFGLLLICFISEQKEYKYGSFVWHSSGPHQNYQVENDYKDFTFIFYSEKNQSRTINLCPIGLWNIHSLAECLTAYRTCIKWQYCPMKGIYLPYSILHFPFVHITQLLYPFIYSCMSLSLMKFAKCYSVLYYLCYDV